MIWRIVMPDIEKFSQNSQTAIAAASELAESKDNPNISSAHLLYVLTEDKTGVIPALVEFADGNLIALKEEAESLINREPVVTGGAAPTPSPKLMKILDAAQQTARAANEQYVATERLLEALIDAGLGKNAGLSSLNIGKAIEKLRGGNRPDSPQAEESYQALKKYTTDFTD
jgi:ATP-dependent Clp protease ATP-binding subunit ClpB